MTLSIVCKMKKNYQLNLFKSCDTIFLSFFIILLYLNATSNEGHLLLFKEASVIIDYA